MTFEKLRTEFADLQKKSADVFAAAEAEGRPLTDEERTAHDQRFARIESIKRTIDDHGKFAEMQLAAGKAQTQANPAGQPEAQAEAERQGFAAPKPMDEKQRFAAHRDAVNHYIRTGETRTAKFSLTTGSGSSALLPTAVGTPIVLKRIRNSVRAALLARGRIPIVTADGGTLKIPIFDDSANTADVIAQDSTSQNNKDPSLSALTLGNTLYDSGTIWSSNTLLNSTGFDLLAYLEPMLDERLDVAQYPGRRRRVRRGRVGRRVGGPGHRRRCPGGPPGRPVHRVDPPGPVRHPEVQQRGLRVRDVRRPDAEARRQLTRAVSTGRETTEPRRRGGSGRIRAAPLPAFTRGTKP
jgi:hypothetical protein